MAQQTPQGMIAFVCVCVCCFFVLGGGGADSSCSVSGVIGWSGISFASVNSADRPNDTRGRDLDSKDFWAFISEATLQEIRPGGLPIYKEYNRTKYAIPVRPNSSVQWSWSCVHYGIMADVWFILRSPSDQYCNLAQFFLPANSAPTHPHPL